MLSTARRLVAVTALAWALPSAADDIYPAYKCGDGQYSQSPCAGGQVVTPKRVFRSYDTGTPTAAAETDRSRQVARARRAAEVREQCTSLETVIRTEEARQRMRLEPPSEAEEGELAMQRVRFREMRC